MIKLRFPGDFIYISSPFGMRTLNGVTSMHKGIDLGWSSKYGGENTPVLAAADGIIETSVDGKNNDKTSSTYGNYIVINHGDGIKTLYAHLLKGSVLPAGTRVTRSQQIARKNNSGYSFGSHCHFEVRINGVQVDPLLYTYADVNMIISSDTKKKYKILTHDFSYVEPTPSNELEIGNNIVANGTLYSNSYGGAAGKTLSNYKGKITYKNMKGTKPYHIDNLGWMSASDVVLDNRTAETTYVVKAGDNLSKIASKYKTTWQKIYNDNKSIIGNNPNLIKPGQRLVIK